MAAAIGGYVADRCNLPPGALTRAEIIGHLHRNAVMQESIDEVESLLARCESMRYAGGAPAGSDSIAERCARCIAALERERIA